MTIAEEVTIPQKNNHRPYLMLMSVILIMLNKVRFILKASRLLSLPIKNVTSTTNPSPITKNRTLMGLILIS